MIPVCDIGTTNSGWKMEHCCQIFISVANMKCVDAARRSVIVEQS
jgi:hypothetical protein